MAYASIVCYHHSNCEDRPAVSTCSNCGKGLCTECTDKLRSPKTGKILCVDCLNAELREGAALSVKAKNAVKSEIVGMIVGGVIGIIVAIILGVLLSSTPFLFLAFFMPTLFASFFTLFNFARGRGFFLGILFFLGGIIASPIVFIRRLVVRLKNIKTLKEYAAYQTSMQETNKLFFETARKMKTKKESEQEYFAKLRAEYDKKFALLVTQVGLSEMERNQRQAKMEADLQKQMDEFKKEAQEQEQYNDASKKLSDDMMKGQQSGDNYNAQLNEMMMYGRGSQRLVTKKHD